MPDIETKNDPEAKLSPPTYLESQAQVEVEAGNSKKAEEEEVRVIKPEYEGLLQNTQGDSDGVYNNPTVEIMAAASGEPEMARIPLRVYRQRWFILAVIAFLNNFNCVAWIAFAPVANHVDTFYHFEGATNWFSMVYMIVTVPVGIFAMWAGRYFGLRVSILVAAWANALGVAIRLGSSFLPPHLMFPIGIAGQAVAAIAYPFIMFLPTKVAGSWFPADERAKATTIGVMANPLGVLLSNILAPQLVKSADDVLLLNIIVAVPAIILCLIATIGVKRSEPKTPPTLSAAQEQMKFVDGLKSCFTSKPYVILLVVMGGGIGMFNCLYTVLQQLLCPYGYDNAFSGLCAAMMIIGGVIGATASGIFVDRTRRYTETMKVSMTAAVFFGLTFLQISMFRDISYLIAATCFLFGVMGLAMYPVGLEMSAECTFPVAETTSTGLVVLSGQIQAVIFMAIMTQFSSPLEKDQTKYQVCDPHHPEKAKNYSLAIYIISGIAISLVILLVALFKPVYKRMNAEKGAALIETEGGKLIGIA